MRNSLEIQEDMLRKRIEKVKSRNGWSEIELINWANNPKNYKRKHK